MQVEEAVTRIKVAGAVSSTTNGSTPGAALHTVKSLLSELKSQIQCDAVLCASNGSEKLPTLFSTNGMAKVRAAHGCRHAPTPSPFLSDRAS